MRQKLLTCIFLLFCAVSACAGVRGRLREGGNYYNQQKYGSALGTYQSILRENPKNEQALFNSGNAYYRLNEFTQAQEAFKQTAELGGEQAQNALFNLGNAYYRAGDNAAAIESYKAAILADPADKEAIHNLQLVISQQQSQQNQDQQNQNNQSNSSSNQSQQNQDKNQGQAPQSASNPERSQQLSKKDAERIMSMAKENEYKSSPSSGGNQDQTVEKDW